MKQSKFYQIKNITEREYTLVGCDGSVITRPIQDVDKSASAFAIQDAKDGDVLVDEDNNIGIYKEIEGICWHSYIYLGCDNRLYGFSIGGSHVQNNTNPATKEQREQLEKAMADAGYTFDFEKKELKKIEQKPAEWTEEDNMMLQYAIEHFERQKRNCIEGGGRRKVMQEFIDWLKSLRPKSHWKPSKEQIEGWVKEYRDSLPFIGDYDSYGDALAHSYKLGLINMSEIYEEKN